MHPVMATNSSRVYFVHVLRVTKKKCLNGEKILNNCDTCTWVRFIFQILSKVSLSMTFLPYLLEQINDKWTVSDTQDSKCDFYR